MVTGRPDVEHGEANRREHKDDRRPGGEPGEHIGRGAGAEGGLRSLAAECACEVGRAALLQEHNANEEQAHKYMDNNNEVEKDLHGLNCFLRLNLFVRLNRSRFCAEEAPLISWSPKPLC